MLYIHGQFTLNELVSHYIIKCAHCSLDTVNSMMRLKIPGISFTRILHFKNQFWSDSQLKNVKRQYSFATPFAQLYQKVTGEIIPSEYLKKVKQKEPHIESISWDELQCTLDIIKKFGITAEDACHNPHLFCMNPISMDNYGEILKECGFIKISPEHIIRYNTIVKSRTVAFLKKNGLLNTNSNLEEVLLELLKEWPDNEKYLKHFPDATSNILTIRMSVLERYLKWRLAITSEDFQKYCKNYLPLRHRPLCDIVQSIDIARDTLKLDDSTVRRNGFLISCDPLNTLLILEKVDSLAGYDIKDAIKLEPSILKNNCNSLLEIKKLLEEYQISEDAQKRCLRIFCLSPKAIRERFEELINTKEYQVLASNPRVLTLIVYKRKMLRRLSKINVSKKQCFSLNHLISADSVFNVYLSSFGNKTCGSDIAILMNAALQGRNSNDKAVLKGLKRHKYWLHTPLQVLHENIVMLKKNFTDDVILRHSQLLLYPA
ncbi:unnamed protein product [Leptidea sinapis]|uniref:Uncharacterized protein n=1 Tax=Leptidea sinapis TaxID=189913 RepID=A0A5E4Q8R0_9NEOP|nr:unnamed protein product [Leptidea sinapis]